MLHALRLASLAVVLAGLVALSPQAHAHTTLAKSNIASGAELTRSPPEITLEFRQKISMGSIELLDAAGTSVPISFKPPQAPANAFTIPMPSLAKGDYRLNWRFVAKDGHTQTGSLRFSIVEASAVSVQTSIADGAALPASPERVTMTFSSPARLTRARLATAGGRIIPVRFDVPLSGGPTATVSFPRLSADSYVLQWGGDAAGAPLTGTLRFQVR